MIALLTSLASELAPRGVHVHVIATDADGRPLGVDEVADRVWEVAGVDDDGHIRSFAHAH